MHFGFDDEQLALGDAVRDLLAKECPPEVVRAAWEAPPGELDRSVWTALADMGVFSMLVPAASGGLGLDERSLVLVLEETGYAALPHPVVETAAVAIPLLVDTADGGSHIDALLEDMPSEGSMTTSNLGGPNVPCAADADFLLLHDSGAGRLQLVAHPHILELEPLDTVDRGRRAAGVTWSGGMDLTGPNRDPLVALAYDRGALGTAAQLVGLGQRMLDITVAYVSERQQFGQAVGAFQAVKHHMADALKELAFARPAVYRAAHSIATGAPTRSRDVSMAKAMASDAASFVGRQALQCHGAIGYTTESDLHLFLKRTWALSSAWGSASWHRDRVATHILPSAGAATTS